MIDEKALSDVYNEVSSRNGTLAMPLTDCYPCMEHAGAWKWTNRCPRVLQPATEVPDLVLVRDADEVLVRTWYVCLCMSITLFFLFAISCYSCF